VTWRMIHVIAAAMKLILSLALLASFAMPSHASASSMPAPETAPPASMTLEFARKLADRAALYARKRSWNIAIAIVNSEGNLIYFQRDENAYSGSIEASIQKAKSASAFQRPTSVFADAVKAGHTGLLTIKDVVALEGGVPVSSGNRHIGAIGISGAHSVEDEECANAAIGVTALGLR